jgi:hypothetical protein
MRTHPWRDRILLRCRSRFRSAVHAAAARTSVIGTSIIATSIIAGAAMLPGALPVLAGDGKAPAERFDTEHLFGFVEGADIGGKGDAEFVAD